MGGPSRDHKTRAAQDCGGRTCPAGVSLSLTCLGRSEEAPPAATDPRTVRHMPDPENLLARAREGMSLLTAWLQVEDDNLDSTRTSAEIVTEAITERGEDGLVGLVIGRMNVAGLLLVHYAAAVNQPEEAVLQKLALSIERKYGP